MQQYTGAFAPAAERQLNQLYDYIAANAGALRADHYVSGIVNRCLSLATFPERGTKRDDIRPNLRIMGHHRSATIAFAIDYARQVVIVLGVFYGGQNFEAILGDESE
jgi:plasmid stabilization system protein ParE